MKKNGRVRMWRGDLRCSLSVAAPFVWRCLNSRTITPFPHPPHRTGHAELPHPALGQDSMPLHTKGHPHYTRPSHRTVYPDVHRSSNMHLTDNATTWAATGFPACTLAKSPGDPLHQRLQPLRYLHDCSDCFRLERLPGGTLAH